jgi:hypothetical protein
MPPFGACAEGRHRATFDVGESFCCGEPGKASSYVDTIVTPDVRILILP